MNNVTVIRNGAVGDFTLTLPALKAVRQAFPHCALHIVGPPSTCALAQSEHIIDGNHPDLAPLYATPPLLERTRQLFAKTEFLLAYSHPGGIDQQHLEKLIAGKTVFWDPHPAVGNDLHIVDHLLMPLRQLNMAMDHARPQIDLVKKDFSYVNQLSISQPIIAHPGSGGAHKCWPLERYVQWARALAHDGVEVLFLCGPTERERGFAIPNDIPTLAPPNLRSLAALLSRARLFVGNDSGPGHIAAAVNTTTLSLFGPTEPRVWAPQNAAGHILHAADGDLGKLSVATVFNATRAIL
jgi:heptosyltransferase-2